MKMCSVEGCGNKSRSCGLCDKHYARMRRHGHLNETRRPVGAGSIDDNGYIVISKGGVSKRAHVIIAEKALGKSLPKGAEVHHVDGNPANNNPKNLVVCLNHEYHGLIEQRTRAYNTSGHADWVRCCFCKQYDDPKNMYLHPTQLHMWHRSCNREYQRNLYRLNKIKFSNQETKMNIRFSLSSGDRFVLSVPDGSDVECYQLSKDACRFEFWRAKTDDVRIVGHTLTWEVVNV